MKLSRKLILFLFLAAGMDAQEKITVGTFEGTDLYRESVSRAFREGGIEVEFRELPPLRSLQMVQEGTLDAELARPEGEEAKYPSIQRVPVPLTEDRILCVVRKDRRDELLPQLPETLNKDAAKPRTPFPLTAVSLRGLRVTDSATEVFSRTELVPDWKTAFFLLENRKADVLICPETLYPYSLRFAPYDKDRYTIIGPVLKTFPLYFYLHKQKKDLIPRLVPLLEKAAQEIKVFRKP